MLYERWLQVVGSHAHELALSESWSGRRWTFGELAGAVEALPVLDQSVAFPGGRSHTFILEVLRTWRDGKICCPLEEGQAQLIIPPLPNECVHLKLTSGSTGQPRLIAFTGDQLAADARNIVSTMGLRPEWPNLGVISLAHSYGFSNLVLPLLLHGIPLLLVDAPLPAMVLAASKQVEDLTIAAVPALWRTWHEANSLPSNVRLAISAGAPLPLALESEIFIRSGLKIHNFYGSSECGGIGYDRSVIPRTDASAVGSAMDNVRLTVNGEGCLEVRGEAVGIGYFPGEPARLSKGCFTTSDLAEIRNGCVHLLGRATDVINVAGRKVSPEAIELALANHPAVSACIVFGVPSEDVSRGDNIIAMVRLSGDAAVETLRQHLLARLAAWQLPREWVITDELTTNARGKMPRAEWRKRWLERKAG
ncbi:MAG: lcfB 3 [Verrucomicrobia bacterium]|jgi:acyl-coenzyme A synthetase/AMP-(fatty) acid ligase|nr:lcfB 3 [Verrucomicrobiota bacterium]